MFMVYNKFIQRYPNGLQFFGTLIFGFLTGIAVIKLLCMYNIVDLNSKKYVYVDIEKIIGSVNVTLKQQIEEKKINDDQINDKLLLAKNRFDLLLDNYVLANNAIIISSSKVIAGANDITGEFLKQTLEVIK